MLYALLNVFCSFYPFSKFSNQRLFLMETILLDDCLDEGIIREKSFRDKVDNMDLDKFHGKKVIIKGCASVTVPTWAYLILTAQIAQVADKIYYGEPRYAVKIFNILKRLFYNLLHDYKILRKHFVVLLLMNMLLKRYFGIQKY